MLQLIFMYDLQSYLGKMSAGLLTHNRIDESRFGKTKKNKKTRILTPLKVEGFLFHLSEDDLP